MCKANIRISVVTICYNAAGFIEETIKSVVSQDYGNIEYIVIDGGSTDGTQDIIKKYSDSIDYFVSEPDRGIYDAMNKGISAATGDYINFMNGGDIFFNRNVVSSIFNNPAFSEADIIYGDTVCKFSNGYSKRKVTHESYMPTCHQSIFVSTGLLKKHPFDLSYRILGDRHSFIQLRKGGYTFKYIPKFVAIYDMTGISSFSSENYYLELCRTDNKKARKAGYILFLLKNKLSGLRDKILYFLSLRFPKTMKRLTPVYAEEFETYTRRYPLNHFIFEE